MKTAEVSSAFSLLWISCCKSGKEDDKAKSSRIAFFFSQIDQFYSFRNSTHLEKTSKKQWRKDRNYANWLSSVSFCFSFVELPSFSFFFHFVLLVFRLLVKFFQSPIVRFCLFSECRAVTNTKNTKLLCLEALILDCVWKAWLFVSFLPSISVFLSFFSAPVSCFVDSSYHW